MTNAWTNPLEHPRRIVRLVQLAWRWIGQEAIPQMAAALAYRSIFSLIPMVLLAFLTVRVVGNAETYKELLRKGLDLTGLGQVAVKAVDINGNPVPGAFDLEKWLDDTVKSFSNTSAAGIGLITGITLIYAAFSLLVEIEKSFNRVYGAISPRSWARRVTHYWLVLSLGPILVYASFLTAEKFGAVANDIAQQGSSLFGSWLISVMGFVTSVFITGVLLSLIYTTVPNTRVRVKPAVIGAAAAALGMEIAKYAFRFYLARAGFQSFYGALAVLPLFLLWLYLTWFIVLAGLRVSFILQHGSHGLLIHLWRDSGMERSGLLGSAWIDPSSAVNVMIEVANGFRDGKPQRAEQIADNLRLDALLVRRVLARLNERQLVVRVAGGHSDSFTLGRPAEMIETVDVLHVGFDLAGPLGSGQGDRFVGRMRDAQIAGAAGVTLAQVLSAGAVRSNPTAATADTPSSPQPARAPALSGGNA